jgi:hypothetical protein
VYGTGNDLIPYGQLHGSTRRVFANAWNQRVFEACELRSLLFQDDFSFFR